MDILLSNSKSNVGISILMMLLALIFILFMGISLVHSTQHYWQKYAMEDEEEIVTLVG